jgi:anti-sigma factor RsiW
MSDCRNLEPLFAPYVDGDAEPQTRSAIDRHLVACPPCRDRVAAERAAREVLLARRQGLRACATQHLRSRCAAQRALAEPASASPAARPGFIRRTLIPLSMAASLLLVVGAIFFFGLNRGVELLAAQLAADHVKCHWFADHDARPDPTLLSTEWKKDNGWPLKVPASTPELDLQLVGIRRCGSTEGPNAHILYNWRGTELSVYVMNRESSRATEKPQFVTKVGEETVIWSEGGRTYAVVASGNRRDLAPLVDYVKLSARTW